MTLNTRALMPPAERPSSAPEAREQATPAQGLEPLQALWPEAVRLDAGRGSDYFSLASFFLPACSRVTSEQGHSLALFTRLLASSILLHDEVADGDTPPGEQGAFTLRIMALQFEAWQCMTPFLPAASPFWGRLRTYLAAYAEACLDERRFASAQRPWAEYTEAVARRIILGKNGVAHAVVAALVALEGNDSLYAPLITALDGFNLATQLCDDLTDWKEDLRNGIPSLLLVRFVPERPVSPPDGRELARLTRELYYGGHASHVLRLALAGLDAAEHAPRALAPEMPWYKVVSSLRRRCQGILADVERIIDENVRRVRTQPRYQVELPPARGRWQRTAWSALEFLSRQWRLGFGEARDLLQHPETLGLEFQSTSQYGDVFQRALIAEVLSDADPLLGGALRPLLEHEVRHVLGCKLPQGFGGWSYFPNLPELPPDLDDLAQVMNMLLRCGYHEQVVAHCEAPLEVVLRDGALPDGSYEPWMVPARHRTPLQERHAALVQRVWGSGSDAGVMANFLEALRGYDAQRFAEVLRRGLDNLEARQRADGSWESRWYHGPWYGLYACLRVLLPARPRSPAVERALAYVRRGQAADGGWGLEGQPGDALSTALSLVTLAWARMHRVGEPEDEHRARQALGFLESTRGEDGSWPQQWLIDVGKGIHHRSRTLTTAFVLRATLAWEQCAS